MIPPIRCIVWLILIMNSLHLAPQRALSQAVEAPSEKQWEELSRADGITVYRSRVSQERLFTFRGLGRVEAPIPKLIALMSDPSRLPQWVFRCIQGELIERNFKETDRVKDPSGYYQMFYGVYAVPWPLHNRDYVLKAQITYRALADSDLPEVTITMRNVEHALKPQVPSLIRMPVMNAAIVMRPMGVGGRQTLVDFSLTSDPGGLIPAWVSKLASREIPQKTLQNLRILAKSDDYNHAFENLILYHYQRLKDKS